MIREEKRSHRRQDKSSQFFSGAFGGNAKVQFQAYGVNSQPGWREESEGSHGGDADVQCGLAESFRTCGNLQLENINWPAALCNSRAALCKSV